jgi:hypothetical protein
MAIGVAFGRLLICHDGPAGFGLVVWLHPKLTSMTTIIESAAHRAAEPLFIGSFLSPNA